MGMLDITIGPRTGPTKRAVVNIAMARPLLPESNISDTAPPALVMGEVPAVPAVKRSMIKVHMFWLAMRAR